MTHASHTMRRLEIMSLNQELMEQTKTHGFYYKTEQFYRRANVRKFELTVLVSAWLSVLEAVISHQLLHYSLPKN